MAKMARRLVLCCAGLVGAITVAHASDALPAPLSSTARLTASWVEVDGDLDVQLEVHGAAGDFGQLMVTVPGQLYGEPFLDWTPAGLHLLPTSGPLTVLTRLSQSLDTLPGGIIEVCLLHAEGDAIVSTPPAKIQLTTTMECVRLDFETDGFGDPILPGVLAHDQFQTEGLLVGAHSNGLFNAATYYDTGAGTPGQQACETWPGMDCDLQTPGYGPGNDEARGNVLIISENYSDDLPPFNQLDDADDEETGGSLFFVFDHAINACGITLLDCEQGAMLRFYDGLGAMPDISVPPLADNEVRELEFLVEGVFALEVILGGEGAVADFSYVPCIEIVNWDETTLGFPIEWPAGTIMQGNPITEVLCFNVGVRNMFDEGFDAAFLGGGNSHPEMAILFDTGAPTGGDFDLEAPGYGIGNDTPEGLVLIVAEDDTDLLPPLGVIDDPDDEAGGGVLTISFDEPVTVFDVEVLDIDTYEWALLAVFQTEDLSEEPTILPLQALGDNSKQSVDVNMPGVTAFQLVMSGSGALAGFSFCKKLIPPQLDFLLEPPARPSRPQRGR
jgi:hypothetical protein